MLLGIDYIAYNGTAKCLVQVLFNDINEKVIDEFNYLIEKYNRNGFNYLYTNSTVSKEIGKYAKDNKIEIIDRSKILEQLNNSKLSEENILTSVVDTVRFNL